MSNISAVLKERRKSLGLTLAQIAAALDVTEATVQRWESGNIKNLRYERITKLASILGVSPSCLMGWSESPIPEQDTLGDRLVEVRKNAGLTQKMLADLLGITATKLNYWEKNKRVPSLDMISKICETLNIKSEYLLGQADKKNAFAPEIPEVKANNNSVSVQEVTAMLEALGLVQPGRDLDEQDLDFLLSIGNIVSAWFNKPK